MRWLLVMVLTGCGFDLEASVTVRSGSGQLNVEGAPAARYQATYSFSSFQAALDDPATLTVEDGTGVHALPLSVDVFAAYDCDRAQIDYVLAYDGGQLHLGINGGSREYSGGGTSIVVD